MITVSVIKSPKAECKTCHETHRVVEETLKSYQGKATLEVITNGTPEAQAYGIISTPVIAIEKKIRWASQLSKTALRGG